MRLKHRSSVVLGGLFLFLLCCSFSAPGSAAAITAEPMYMITQSEMERLSDNLTRLKKINEESQIELKALRKELATSKVELTRSQEAVNRAEESAGRIDSGIQEAGSLIEDSQRILERVRQRGKAN